MHCIVRSADRTLIDGEADRVVARSPHGEFAVMEGHAPLLAVLVPGVIRVQIQGADHAIVCKGGTFHLSEGNATLLVERPYLMEEVEPSILKAQIADFQAQDPTESQREEIAYLELLCRVKETYA